MGSLLTSFGVGVQGIRSAQSGLNTTAHNLANTKTEGYTRQQNINSDMVYQTYKVTDKATLQIGLGTRVDSIRQIRDQFLDKEYRLEISRQTFYDRQYETANEIEDIFGEMEGVEFLYSIEGIWEEIQNLSTDPGNIAKRKLFISGAESFLDRAYDIYKELTNYQTGLNNEIAKQVDRINEISDQIAECNLTIAQIEASGVENANDYRDLRNSLMDELAEYTYYYYQEDVDGKIQIYINSAPLVIEGNSYHMRCEEISEDTGMYKVVWDDNGYGDVYDIDKAYSHKYRTDTGSLNGILTARGKKFTNYKDLPIPPAEPQIDDFRDEDGVIDQDAYEEAYHEYEVLYKQFEEDTKVFNNTTGNSIITKIESQLDRLVHDMVTIINDVFCPNINYTTDGISGVDADGKEVSFEEGTYKVLDVVNCPVGADDEGTIGEELFKRRNTSRYTVVILDAPVYRTDADGNPVIDEDGNQIPLTQEFTDSEGNTGYKLYVYNDEKDDIFSQYTIRNLEMNNNILANYSLLPIKENPLAGMDGVYSQGEGGIYSQMLEKWYEKSAVLDPNTPLTVYSYSEYYKEMIDGLGTQGKVWKTMVDDQTKLVESVEDKRQQMAGVSTDEELVYLLQYQHAFNAASRYINAIDQMLQHLIERLA